MLTEKQFKRKYECPCFEEGIKCEESFRYHQNLIAHILKVHRFEKEGKDLMNKKLKQRRSYYLKKWK
jgi:uncharacterized C2H2 Zn-finger protein